MDTDVLFRCFPLVEGRLCLLLFAAWTAWELKISTELLKCVQQHTKLMASCPKEQPRVMPDELSFFTFPGRFCTEMDLRKLLLPPSPLFFWMRSPPIMKTNLPEKRVFVFLNLMKLLLCPFQKTHQSNTIHEASKVPRNLSTLGWRRFQFISSCTGSAVPHCRFLDEFGQPPASLTFYRLHHPLTKRCEHRLG